MGKRYPTAAKFEGLTVLGSDLHPELFCIPDIAYLLPVRSQSGFVSGRREVQRNSEMGETTH